jgi:hypothetical protein
MVQNKENENLKIYCEVTASCIAQLSKVFQLI